MPWGAAPQIPVFKVYTDGFVRLDLGASAAQLVVLMIMVNTLTVFQLRNLERRSNTDGRE